MTYIIYMSSYLYEIDVYYETADEICFNREPSKYQTESMVN